MKMEYLKYPFVKIKKGLGKIYRFIFHGPIFWFFMKHTFFLRHIYDTKDYQSRSTFKIWFFQKIIGFNRYCYWPVHFTSTVRFPKNILVGIGAAPGISPGCYIQAVGKIYIGDYTQIAPNVGIISSNHFILDIREHVISEIKIGDYCRIGMGSIILPGVELGDFTTVSAGSVVTKSFKSGYCVLAGNPAKIVADYSNNESIKEKFIRYKHQYEYNGFITSSKFEKFRKSNLNI